MAIAAWDWYHANEIRDDCDPQVVKAGDADLSIEEQRASEVVAAIYLFSLTGEEAYDAVVQEGFDQTIRSSMTDSGATSPSNQTRCSSTETCPVLIAQPLPRSTPASQSCSPGRRPMASTPAPTSTGRSCPTSNTTGAATV